MLPAFGADAEGHALGVAERLTTAVAVTYWRIPTSPARTKLAYRLLAVYPRIDFSRCAGIAAKPHTADWYSEMPLEHILYDARSVPG